MEKLILVRRIYIIIIMIMYRMFLAIVPDK